MKRAHYCAKLADFFRSYEGYRGAAISLGLSGVLTKIEYDDLLKGTNANINIPLWASAAKNSAGLLCDETTLEIIKIYKANGYEPEIMDGNPKDYIGSQLDFMSYLRRCGEHESDFSVNYFADTVKAFSAAALKAAGTKWFSAEAKAEIEKLCALLAIAAGGGDSEIIEKLEALTPLKKGTPISVEPEKLYKIANVNDCGAKCLMNARVQEGCLLGTLPDKEILPFTGCPRGRSYRNTFMTMDRLRYPMERRGERGEGLFRRISWEEAEEKIADKITDVRKKYGPGGLYITNASGVSATVRGDKFMHRLLGLGGGYLGSYNYYSATCVVDMMDMMYGDNIGGNYVGDHLNSKLLILWGHNPADTQFGPFHNDVLSRCKEKGIPIIVIDPRMSDTAIHIADKWIAIRPSSDPAMIDAMCYTIFKEGLEDRGFIDKFCLGFTEEHMPEGVPAGNSYESYLFGKKDGIEKTPEWAEKICGVPAETIKEIARLYATSKPAALLPGLGPQRTGCGEQTARGFIALACLTGNVGISGGSSGGTIWPGRTPCPDPPAFSNPYPLSFPSFLWTRTIAEPESITPETGLKGGDKLECGVKMIFSLGNGQTLNQHSNINETIEMYKKPDSLEMTVLSDLFMTPGARWADIVLPAKSFLEQDNIVAPWSPDNYFLFNNRCMDGLFGWKFEYDWIKSVAEKLGLGEEFGEGHESADDWLRFQYEELVKTEPEMAPYEETKAKGIQLYRNKNINYIAFEENIKDGKPFNTPSGKIEIFSKKLWDMGERADRPAIPGFIDCPEGPTDPLKEKYPLQLIAFHTRRRAHSIHDNNKILDEIEPPRLWVNRKDAEKRGIKEGDRLRIFNERGEIFCPAHVTDEIMEGVISLTEGVWYTPDENGIDTRGCVNVLTHTIPTPISFANPQHTTLAEIEKAED